MSDGTIFISRPPLLEPMSTDEGAEASKETVFDFFRELEHLLKSNRPEFLISKWNPDNDTGNILVCQSDRIFKIIVEEKEL